MVAVKRYQGTWYIITTAAAVRTESGHTKKPQITQITETKKNRLRLSISKKEAKGKKNDKLISLSQIGWYSIAFDISI